MRIGTCVYKGNAQLCVVQEEEVFLPLSDASWNKEITSVLSLIDAGDDALNRLRDLSANATGLVPLSDVELLSPIPRPRQNVMCMGWNYKEHVAETATDKTEEVKLPRSPIVFTKAASSMNGPYADIPVDVNVSAKMDWESELGVVISKSGKGITKEDAYQHVFGYTVINDVTARDRQKWHKQFFIGKSFTGACPMGPWIVTADEIENPHDLAIRSWVNGDLKQESNTSYQIFDIPTQIETLSLGMELEAGDIIATGTPSGVGYARTPPEYLMPGDVVECEVEKVGRISNKIVAP